MSMDMSGMSMASSTVSGMNMATSTMSGMATSTMSGMTMETGSSMGHGSMGSMDGMSMSMKDMMMVFFTATNTPLYSAAWTPSTTGQYAGTCIFLIFLALIFRFIIAVRVNLSMIAGAYAFKKDTALLRSQGLPTDTVTRRWTLNDRLVCASVDTILAGVSYLLMLAVMTMNVGYFLSILGGTFAGSFMVGRWTAAAGH